MNISPNEWIILGILVIIIIALVVASRNSVITIKRDLPPEDKPRSKPALQPAPKPKKPEVIQKSKYAKTTARTTPNDNGWEPWSGNIDGETFVVNFYGNDITTIEVGLGTKLPAPLEINLREYTDLFSQLTGLFKSIPKEHLKGYAKIINEVKTLLEMGANYIDLGYNTNRIAAEFPIPPDQMPKDVAEEAGRLLVSIKKKLAT